MAEDADYRFALELQKRLNADSDDDDDVIATEFKAPLLGKQKLQQIKRSNPRSNLDEEFLNRTQNLVHPMWETLDPTPDVKALFGAFDSKFFQDRLKCVTLEWSKRMFSCAGICYSSKNRFGMSITIRLSEPLLKLRPRKDLVETMLHEMIHAYCFVLNIREGNGGHGPHFKKIMQAINKVAGTNITVYHTFHDEVRVYKQHIWRCNGVCQNRSPFFGYVKRTCNRAPNPNDQWWAAHHESCGGTFLKIKGPEPKKKKKENPKAVQNGGADIRKFFDNTSSGTVQKPNRTVGSFATGIKGPIKSNGGGTMLLNPKTNSTSIAKAFPPTSYPGLSSDPFNTISPKSNDVRSTKTAPGGNLRNVVGFRDLNEGSSTFGSIGQNKFNRSEMVGHGYAVGAISSPSTDDDGIVDREKLRRIWSKRFNGATVDSESDDNKEKEKSTEPKRRRISEDETKTWEQVDDDVMIRDVPVQVVTLSSDDDDNDSDGVSSSQNPAPKAKPLTTAERQNAIKQEILDETANLTDDDIILIDDEYDDNLLEDDNLTAATALADTSIIDEFFGEDTLLRDFMLENDVRPTFSRNIINPDNDIVTCPVCQQKLKRIELEEHLNGCTGIAVKVLLPVHLLKKSGVKTKEVKPTPRSRPSKKDILRAAGYSEQDLVNITASSAEDESDSISLNDSDLSIVDLNESVRSERMRNVYKTTRQCPVCSREIEEDEMNVHLDDCLS